ncbi:MAG: transposase [Dehalococcoidia bacterium]
MHQNTQDKHEVAEERSQDTQRSVRQVRSATRRKYTAEEKIHIVLEGFRREVTVNELCRREGIKPNNFYSWTKEFMEAGKQRLSRTPHEMPLARRSTLSSEKAPISNIW